MKTPILICILCLIAATAPIAAQEEATPPREAAASACLTCHGELDDEVGAPVRTWDSDVHMEAGLGCHDCHGGNPSAEVADDPEASMDPSAGYESPPDRLGVARFCARCHSDAAFMKRFNPQARVDQWVEYQTSAHGKAHAAGDPVPATCTDCHGAHGVRPVASPDSPVYASNVPETCASCHGDAEKMRPYGLPADQLAEYMRSAHAVALLERDDTSAPACNDCHGNHGASPPGVQSVANVCGQCHGREAMLFRTSFKKELFDEMGESECAVCHGNHRITHPTPELFRSGSGPATTRGRITSVDPLRAEIGSLGAGETAEVRWESVLRPDLDAGDERLQHVVVVSAEGLTPVEIDATVQPGSDPVAGEPRVAGSGGLSATLVIESPYGAPVQPGDAVVFRLELRASSDGALSGVTVDGVAGTGLAGHTGSICLTCHEVGDACDVATEEMYAAISTMDHEIRAAEAQLHRAEVAGMFVSDAEFELKRGGKTASVEARALLHTFDKDRVFERAEEGRAIATAAREAGDAALAELQVRRKGLAVSLVLVGFVLIGLFLKIRQVERSRASAAR